MHHTILLLSAFALSLSAACGATSGADAPGHLSLSLSSQAGGVGYRLDHARFTLEGPETRGIVAEGDDPLELTLPAGAYALTLLDGWSLSRVTEPGVPVMAELLSENPLTLLVEPGQRTQALFRFALRDGQVLPLGPGRLDIGLAIEDAGSGAAETSHDACRAKLVINEVDYEQDGPDDAEFVELVNVGLCAAQLSDVTLELVNAGDGVVYGRVALAQAGESLAPGARLVVADDAVLLALPSGVVGLRLSGAGLQNGGPDGLRLVRGDVVLDTVSYEGSISGWGDGPGAGEDTGAGALARCPDGFDADHDARDFLLVTPTPGSANVCP
jgi:hypothetical protein